MHCHERCNLSLGFVNISAIVCYDNILGFIDDVLLFIPRNTELDSWGDNRYSAVKSTTPEVRKERAKYAGTIVDK